MAKRKRAAGLSDGTEDATDLAARTTSQTNGERSLAVVSNSPKKGSMSKHKKSEASALQRLKQPVLVGEKSNPARTRIIVGVDFGTTFSGISYVMSSNSDARDVMVVTDWTGGARRNEQLEKVPSRIAYKAENEGFEEDQWGYEVEPGQKSYTWFKLLLDTNAMATEFDNPHLQKMQNKEGNGLLRTPRDKTAQDVASDYLTFVYKHVVAKLAKTYTREVVKVTPIHYWFTHPAVWTDQANDATRTAAETAGFTSRSIDELFMITEPEAAAMSILSESIEKGAHVYKVGMNVLIADLGGGTIDVQVLKIISLDPLKTEEACEGSGGKSGSTYIDFGLHEYMEANFGEAFKKLPAAKIGAGSKFVEDFQVVPKTFNGKDLKKMFRLSLPALGKALRDRRTSPTGYDFEDGDVLIRASDVEQMFSPVVAVALSLITEQYNLLEKIKELPFRIIALCGGLGTSEYIWTKFQEHCDGILEGKVELVTDERAWSSVVRGACVRGLEGNMVLAKKARRCYGVEVHQPFREGIDKEEKAFTDDVGGKRAPGYVHWLVKKGKKFTPSMRETLKVYVALEDDEEDLVYHWDLYTCSSDHPPSRIDGEGVEKIARIKINLAKAVGKAYKRTKTAAPDTRKQDCVYLTLSLKLGDDKGTLKVEGMWKRTVVGETVISYVKDNTRKPVRSAGLI